MSNRQHESAVSRNAIGFEALLKFAERESTSTYPPHNIMRISTTKGEHYRLILAVSGFTKDDLVVAHQDGVLLISGSRPATIIEFNPDENEGIEYLYRGIAFREFSRQFKIGLDVEITGAKLENGLLQIDLRRIIPESEKAKIIAIR